MQQGFHLNPILNATIHIYHIFSIAFKSSRRLIMLRGLPGINAESVQLVALSW